MLDRRIGPRLLCADMVEIRWTEKNGRVRRRRANLEDISPSGAGLLVEHPVPVLTAVRLRHENGELTGTVRYCTVRENEYVVGIEFDEGSRWSAARFRPRHLLHPRRLRP